MDQETITALKAVCYGCHTNKKLKKRDVYYDLHKEETNA